MIRTSLFMAATALAAGIFAQTDGSPEGTGQLPHLPAEMPAVVEARLEHRLPPEPWLDQDPADSLWRMGREALNRGENRRAAELFHRIWERYGDSGYAPDAYYWEAYALFRSGDTDDLRDAWRVLDLQWERYPEAAARSDARALLTRVLGELARRGDAEAKRRITITADSMEMRDDRITARGSRIEIRFDDRLESEAACDRGDDDMRIAAIQAIRNMDDERALPLLKQVLSRRDRCSAKLRAMAVLIVGDIDSPESADVLLDVVRNDPESGVRLAAVQWLSEVESDRAVEVLDSILHASRDRDIREKALFALAEQDNPRARRILRDFVESPNTPDELKGRAIFNLGHHGAEREDGEFLRRLYPRLRSPALRETAIQSIAQIENAENGRWLLQIARDPQETLELRKKALFWAGEAEAPIADVVGMYESLNERELKEHVLFVLSERDEREATDKLIQVARAERDRDLRKKAIFWLGEKDDPRVRELLLEIINAEGRRP